MKFLRGISSLILLASLLVSGCSRTSTSVSEESLDPVYQNPVIEHLRTEHDFVISKEPTADLQVVPMGNEAYQIKFSDAGRRKLPENAWPVIQMTIPDGPGTAGDVERLIVTVDGAIHEAIEEQSQQHREALKKTGQAATR